MSLIKLPVEHPYIQDAHHIMEIHDRHVLAYYKELEFLSAWDELFDCGEEL